MIIEEMIKFESLNYNMIQYLKKTHSTTFSFMYIDCLYFFELVHHFQKLFKASHSVCFN